MGNSESSMRKKLEGRPVVVIIGGGFAGTEAARNLDKYFNVVLIDRKNYFFLNIGALRASVNSGFLERIVIPYDNLLTFGHVVQAEVAEVKPDGVQVYGRDEPIKFDYLILATGTSYAFPAKVGEPSAKDLPPLYQQTEKSIQEASEILIIGGGPVGIELLGEIAFKYPEKKIKLIHRHGELIQGKTSERFKEEVLKRVKDIPNVEVILNDEVVIDEETRGKFENRYIKGPVTLETKKGLKIKTDLAFFCGGSKVNNGSFLKNFESKLDATGRLKVNKFLQVEGFSNIFSCGDCANVDETKQGYVAQNQAAHLAKNIILHDLKKPLKEYSPGFPAIFLTMGPKKGVAQFPTSGGMIGGNTITSMIKGETLLAPMFWGIMKQKIPRAWEDKRFENQTEDSEADWLATSLKIPVEEAKGLLAGLQPPKRNSVDFT